jgi:uncharacterized protein YecE (DUF72 family)
MGTSGWDYNEWVGIFYSRGEKKFSQYCRYFDTVEIDSTFYRYPSKGMVFGWLRLSPANFVFSAKLPSLITHDKGLDPTQGIDADLNSFLELMEPLRRVGKLGPILIQLPPSFKREHSQRLECFFAMLPRGYEFAVEFRHRSWISDASWNLLSKYGVAYTIVDEPLLPPAVEFTAGFAYFRWHGRGRRPWYNYRYSAAELEPWIPKLKEAEKSVDRIYGYFNNHYHGYAVENCIEVLRMLGKASAPQLEVLENIRGRRRIALPRPSFEKPESTLEAFSTTLSPVEELLLSFLDHGRLMRAKSIGDLEIRVIRNDSSKVEAEVRDYFIEVDLENRLIAHDCADWSKSIGEKRFCKHLAKLFLVLPRDQASSTLERIRSEKDAWVFRTEA